MNRVFFPAIAVLLMSTVGVAHGADDEIASIREELQALIERVDRLERQNEVLAIENEKLKAQSHDLAAETRGHKESDLNADEVSKAEGSDWTSRITLKGDLRYRHERASDGTLDGSGVRSTADRYRDRIRARIGAEVEATDTLRLGIGLTTTEGGDPRSSNQSLSGLFSRKSLDLDFAYFDWRFAEWGNLIGGKMKQPFFKPGQSLFWDSDINPEGLAASLSRGMVFGTVYRYWLDEVSGPESTVTADTMLYGAQLGARVRVGASTLTIAAHYYDLSAGEGRAPFYDGDPNGNTTIDVPSGASTVAVLANDYRVINLGAEIEGTIGALPLLLWADVAQNRAVDDLDAAWAAGILVGKAIDHRSWELGAAYQVLEKDALFAQLIDSSFGGGNTDSEGFVFRAGYAPVKNWLLNATYFMTERNADIANSVGQVGVEVDRLQVDFNVKF